MDFLDPRIQQYAEEHSTPESPILSELNRETHTSFMLPQMLSGHLQGLILRFVSRLVAPVHALEIGTFTGYSAICIAEGLAPGGMLHTIDNNEELEETATAYWKRAGLAEKIRLYTGDALEIIPFINQTFDLVFIDADKINYSNYYQLVIDKVRPGGVILADNVLWSGKVLDLSPDKETRALMEFNDFVNDDPRVENFILPVRDGIMVMRKI